MNVSTMEARPFSKERVVRLADPTGDDHDESALYELLSATLAADAKLSSGDRAWCEAMLADAAKNRPGQECADLEYETAEGARGHLHGISTPLTLLYFNDPDCFSCLKVKERLDTCATLRELVTTHELTVVALYTGDDTARWLNEEYPDYVVNAVDSNRAVEEEEAFVLPTMPLFYLLNEEHRVVLKNEPSLNKVLQAIATRSPHTPAQP